MRNSNWTAGGRSARALFCVLLLCLGLFGAASSWIVAPSQAQSGGTAVVVEVKGAIGPALAYRVRNTIFNAEGRHELVVLEMDTPGGLDFSMREINQAILNSKVPVATFVYPPGSRAASAGTYILYASHIAAMAPSTTLGAATPVSMSGDGGGGESSEKASDLPEKLSEAAKAFQEGSAPTDPAAEDEAGESAEDADDPNDNSSAASMRRKVINDAAAYIRGLAEQRGRNAEWAEQAVREAVSLTSTEALEINVIDVVAKDIPDLLHQIEGRSVEIAGRGQVTLDTEDLRVIYEEKTWIQVLLEFITDPNVALILMQIGVLGLILELYNPGSIYPGVVGLVSLILGLIALSVLPYNMGGVVLLVIGLAFMVGEIFIASGGLLAVAGAIAFGFGAFFLFDTPVDEFRVSLTMVLISTGIMAFIVFIAVGYGLSAQRRKVVTGREGLVGMMGKVTYWEGLEGYVMLDGEKWKAKSEQPLTQGQAVRAVRNEGLIIWVEPA